MNMASLFHLSAKFCDSAVLSWNQEHGTLNYSRTVYNTTAEAKYKCNCQRVLTAEVSLGTNVMAI